MLVIIILHLFLSFKKKHLLYFTSPKFFIFFALFGSRLAIILKGCSCLCTQELLLAGYWGWNPGQLCVRYTLLAVLSLQSLLTCLGIDFRPLNGRLFIIFTFEVNL